MSDRHVGRAGRRLTATVTDLEVVRQRALVASLCMDGDLPKAERSLDELEQLTDTAGSDVVDAEIQMKQRPDPATYFGKGKVSELAGRVKALDCDVVVVDGELSPVQQRNLQEAFGVDVVDRIALILDIFALHATSREGMAQVELAMNRYRLPRLRGKGTQMSRLAGGIGTRGPGESQLETDRRRVLGRITQLERQIAKMRTTRETQRKARDRSGLPTAALVGYTNAGKSSLLNRLTDAGVLVEDRLFTTLDATVRRLELPSGQTVLVSDTVGFVRDLPHTLVEAFRSTLEESVGADLLLHVIDASTDDPDAQIDAVRATLHEIDSHEVEELLVLNKADVADPVAVTRLQNLNPGAVTVSAVSGDGIGRLLEVLDTRLTPPTVDLDVLLPYDRGDLVSSLHQVGEILSETHEADGTRIKARVPATDAGLFAAFSA
ncbi:MAG TPA: GTPase HflX [Acidimicrobiia bacterium]|nr:GTPase HflX [Acidimicrobiia bacterium]